MGKVLRLYLWHVVPRGVKDRKGREVTEASSPQPVQVACYSGRIYADRPVSFLCQGIAYEVKDIEGEWQQPGERLFVLRTRDDKRFELRYDEGQDQWSATEVT